MRRRRRSLGRPPHASPKEICNNPKLFTTRKYQELLDNKEIDCIVAAVPDHWHKRVVVDATAAGKRYLLRKNRWSHTAAEGRSHGRRAAKKPDVSCKSVRSASAPVICAKAKEMIAGRRHRQTHSRRRFARPQRSHRRLGLSSAARPLPAKFRLGTRWQSGATTRPWDPDMSPKWFARWRQWKEYGTGVAGDLLVHLVSGMNYMLGWNEPPKKVMALGSIIRFPDGRNMPDVSRRSLRIRPLPVGAHRLPSPQSWLRKS